MTFLGLGIVVWIVIAAIALPIAVILLKSIHLIGETEVGLVTKNIALESLAEGNPIAFRGEAGYQADLLMPRLRFKLWPIYTVEKKPWVQVPAGQIGVVIAQIGKPLPPGAKSARYQSEFGHFQDLRTFLEKGGEKGVQRPVLPPGATVPLHPIAFLVLTSDKVYGVPVLKEYANRARDGRLTVRDFHREPEEFTVTQIEPGRDEKGCARDYCGIVFTREGDPLPPGEIASRIGGFKDVERMQQGFSPDASGDDSAEAGAHEYSSGQMIDRLIGTKNELHNNYQDFQAFLDAGGKIGLQHDPLLYGAYNLNPFLVRVEKVPMLVVNQGEVAVIKAYVGLLTEDTSGERFKFGSIVKPGHRGIWDEPLRTGKYAINPRCYCPEIVPTAILTLNWANETSTAHELDARLSQIVAKSNEGFVFRLDLQVQIHVPDTNASKVISMVGTMANLVNEVLQAAVGNHFRDKLQSMPAVKFIDSRADVQKEAYEHMSERLMLYDVETKGVYIQDVIFPDELVQVLTEREIANQRIATFRMQRSAEEQRIDMEAAKGRADQQAELARSEIGIKIKGNDAAARKAEGEGEAAYIERTGQAAGAEIRSIGLARAEAYREQVAALGSTNTAVVNMAEALAKAGTPIVPDVLVVGAGGSLEALAATLTRHLGAGGAGLSSSDTTVEVAVPPEATVVEECEPGGQ